MDSEIKPLID